MCVKKKHGPNAAPETGMHLPAGVAEGGHAEETLHGRGGHRVGAQDVRHGAHEHRPEGGAHQGVRVHAGATQTG